jgi:ethanolamine utilization protein EutA
VAGSLGIELRRGAALAARDRDRLVDALADIVVGIIAQGKPQGLARELLLTEPLATDLEPHLITFTGGVSEYLFGRERSLYGDIAQPLAARIAQAFATGRIAAKMMDPGHGIRATVIGASQFSVQLSGKTIHLGDEASLPLCNVPVVFPSLVRHGDFDPDEVAGAVRTALQRIDAEEAMPIALGIRWHGDPYYARLRALAEGIAQAVGFSTPLPLILIVDGDIGRLLGQILEEDVRVERPIISIDGIALREFDYVDIGEMLRPSNVVPVIIKSLLFPVQ